MNLPLGKNLPENLREGIGIKLFGEIFYLYFLIWLILHFGDDVFQLRKIYSIIITD